MMLWKRRMAQEKIMPENRRKILEMLAAGQITADEAERLIAALEKEPAAPGPANGSESSPKAKLRYLRVVISDEDKQGDPIQVNIRVPLQLLRAGVKLASLIPPQARDHVNSALRREGLPFDLSQLNPGNLEELIEHLENLTVDVDGKKTTVKLFCE